SVIEATVAATSKARRNMELSICADMNPRCSHRNGAALSRRKATETRHAELPASRRPRRGSSVASQAIECRRHDFGEAGGRRQARELGRVDPARLVEFLVEDRLARAPAGGKAQDNEVPLHPVLRIADDGFAEARERNRFDRQAGLLAHLAYHGLCERLADLDHASRQAEQAMGWRTCAPHHEYLAIAHDGGAHREGGTLGIGSCIRHGGGLSKSIMKELTLGEVVCRQPCAAWLVKRSKRDTSRMCGRYMVLSSPEAIRRLFGYPEQPNFPPRYNVAPTQPV